jgi:hypothetical protein
MTKKIITEQEAIQKVYDVKKSYAGRKETATIFYGRVTLPLCLIGKKIKITIVGEENANAETESSRNN